MLILHGSFILFALLIGYSSILYAKFDFRADYYERDLKNNSVRGKGNAWLRSGDLQIWAQEIEYNFNLKIATAINDVHIKENNKDISCAYASYELNDRIITVEDATIIFDQMVISGEKIIKKGSDDYTIINGYYSNCNVSLLKEKDIHNCKFDWQIFGSRIHLTVGGYAHIFDALGYIKDVPIVYTPYLIIPVKSKRETGFLLPYMKSTQSLGTGIVFPFFLNLDAWHDIYVVPTIYSKAGYHISTEYSYIYSYEKFGNFNLTFSQKKIEDDINNPSLISEKKVLFGDWYIKAKNIYNISENINTLQSIKFVSHPYYTFDYYDDIKSDADTGYLKSQISFLSRSSALLTSAKVQYDQSLIVSKDTGCDKGAALELPSAFISSKNNSIIGNFISYDWDIFFSNYFRNPTYDQVPKVITDTGLNLDENNKFDENDLIRTGRRLRVEPKMYVNLSLSNGIFLQPSIRLGGVVYNFDLPNSSFIYRSYIDTEVPLSFYFLKRFNLLGYRKLSHVFQPMVIYSLRPFQSLSANHQFFCQDPITGEYSPYSCSDSTEGRANPRFDVYDLFSKYEYLRFELINRFRYHDERSTRRMFFFKLSQQYNVRTYPNDPRFMRKLGPIELLTELSLWRFYLSLQASYDLEVTLSPDGKKVNENKWSGSLSYVASAQDNITISTYLNNKADKSLVDQYLNVTFYKTLSSFFNIGGQVEYSLKRGEFLGYSSLFEFYSKPKSCWFFSVSLGRTSFKQSFARFDFRLFFGGPADVS